MEGFAKWLEKQAELGNADQLMAVGQRMLEIARRPGRTVRCVKRLICGGDCKHCKGKGRARTP